MGLIETIRAIPGPAIWGGVAGFLCQVVPMEIYKASYWSLLAEVGSPRSVGDCPSYVQICELTRNTFEYLTQSLLTFFIVAAILLLLASFVFALRSFLSGFMIGLVIGLVTVYSLHAASELRIPDYLNLFGLAFASVGAISAFLAESLHRDR